MNGSDLKTTLRSARAARFGLSLIAFWQFAAFFMLLLLIWVNELLDLSSLLYSVDPSPTHIVRGCVLSASILITAIVTVGHTYVQQKRIISGFITVCAKCHKVKLNSEVWERIESYITRQSGAVFSHGYCPDCYEQELAQLADGNDRSG